MINLDDGIKVAQIAKVRERVSDGRQEFDNMEDLSSYANDPRHLAVAKIAKENAEVRACVDFTI